MQVSTRRRRRCVFGAGVAEEREEKCERGAELHVSS
jgi:hypothetical protein